MERPNKITFYRNQRNKLIPGWNVRSASPKRTWMDEYKHMYRCLPMTIANQNGWVIECPCDISAVWFGGQDKRSMHFWLDPEYNVSNQWVKCHFVGGVITFEFDFLVKTNEKVNMLVRGAPNFFIDGAHPLEGVVETDWLNYTFTMNWRVTEINKIVKFKKGDPICFIQPIPHNYAETFDFEIKHLDENPELYEKFHTYNNSRMQFSADKKAGKHNKDWQRHYFNGMEVGNNTEIGEDRHAIKLNLVDPKDQKLVSNTVIVTNTQYNHNHTDTFVNVNEVKKTAYEYVRDCIKTDTAPSPIHGIGTFALCDIKKGEEVFPKWTGESGTYGVTPNEFNALPTYVQNIILKSYENTKENFYWFKLHKDGCFNLANPYVYMNTAEENGNVDSNTGKALKDISLGEEILGTYKLENTKPKLEVLK